MFVSRKPPEEEVPWESIGDEFLRNDLRSLTERLKEVVIDKPLRMTMKIQEFEKNWLTYFICKVDGTKPNIPIGNWIAKVTGNPYTWVDVVNSKGEVQYSVPPILNSKSVKINDGNFYHHIMEIQAMTDHGHPKHVIDAYREKHLLSLIEYVEGSDTFIAYINKIAVYYGYKPFTNELPDGETFKDTSKGNNQESEGFAEEVVRIDEF